jgi:uncharacterized membrane protein YraQ (UPF0718 family)
MLANWRVNGILGITALFFTYFFSLVYNTWQTSLFRAGIGFIFFFVLGYSLRFVLQQIGSNKNSDLTLKENMGEVSNPEVEQKNQVEEASMVESSFHAIPLHSLHNGENEKDPTNIRHTIRTWTAQNKEG